MNKKYYLGIIPVLLIVTFGVVQGTSNTFYGTLKDSNGNPIVSKIEVVNDPNVYSTISSKIDGSYSISIPNGLYNVKFSSINQTSNMPRFYDVEQSVTVGSSLMENLNPTVYTININLKDSSGNNIQSAIIDSGVGQVNINSFKGSEEDLSTTDQNGNAVLHLMSGNFNNVKITLVSGQIVFPSSGRTISVSNNANYNLQLSSNALIFGTIKDVSNNPIRTLIELVSNDYEERTQTDSSGSYSFSIPYGNYTVKFSQAFTNQTNIPKYFDAEKLVNINGNLNQNLSVPILSLSGTINKTSTPIQVKNQLSLGGFNGFSLDVTNTDSNGNFNVKLISSSINTVQIRINGTDTVYSCNINSSNIVC